MADSGYELTPVSPALGATVRGVDLRAVSAKRADGLRAAFLSHHVLFFPDQELTPTTLAQVGEIFGSPTFYPFIEGFAEEPRVIPIIKEAGETKNFGEGWHSDTTYTATPPAATMLYAVDVPDMGGDTLFANMHLAFSRLSESMQTLLSRLRAINSSSKRREGGRAAGNSFQSVKLKDRDTVLEGIHPVARTHPETGAKALYVNALHTAQFDGWTEAESKPLLEFLFRHKQQPEFVYRHRWSARTLAIWDNRCTQHFALNDYHGHRREMLRLSLAGSKPY